MSRDPSSVVIVGAGGFGRETLDVLMACNGSGEGPFYDVIGVVDSGPTEQNLKRLDQLGVKYLGTENEWLSKGIKTQYFIGIGSPGIRKLVSERFDSAGCIPGTAVHPSARFGSLSSPAAGLVVCAGVQVSTNVKIGRHVHLNPNATVGHDSSLGDFVSVNPGAVVSGDVVCGDSVLIGAGAVILQGLKVGSGSIIGAAACVTRNVRDSAVVLGVPAREMPIEGEA